MVVPSAATAPPLSAANPSDKVALKNVTFTPGVPVLLRKTSEAYLAAL